MTNSLKRQVKIFRLKKLVQGFELAPTYQNTIAVDNYESVFRGDEEHIKITDEQIIHTVAPTYNINIEEVTFPVKKKDGKSYIEGEGGVLFYLITPDKEGITEDDLLPNEFDFHINPTRVTPVYSKLVTEIRTKGGWEIQHWGNNLTELSIQGKSGALLYTGDNTIAANQKKGIMLAPDTPLYESLAWKKLMALKRLYELDYAIPDTRQNWEFGLTYFDRFYIGYFINFNGPDADAEIPYIVNYSFTFKVTREVDLSIVSRSFNKSVNSYTRFQEA